MKEGGDRRKKLPKKYLTKIDISDTMVVHKSRRGELSLFIRLECRA
jgi:hypothetical protein